MSQAAPIEPIGWRSWIATLRERRRDLQNRWRDLSPRTRTIVQMSVLIIVVLFAYNYSLSTLLQTAGLDTPLAYVSLVPAIALALAAIRARPMKPEPDIHDRQVDYIVGLPLVAIALAINMFLPSKLSAMFWVWRLDMLTLPIFVAGAVAIIFGVRVLWRQKLAVGYLILAWPYPYQSVLLKVLNAFTDATLFGLRQLLHVVHVAKPASSLDDTLFVISHGGHAFPLSVVSACSGVNSVVGFLLVGSAFGAVVRGPLVRKMLWLLGGMVLLWGINLGRILFIFWAGHEWGQAIAIKVLHPFVGLVTFSIGVVIMILLIKPLGMHIGIAEAKPPVPMTRAGDGPGTPVIRRISAIAVPKIFLATVIVVIASLILGISNFALRSYNLVESAAGEPKLLSYQTKPVAPLGWNSRLESVFNWATPLFGDSSSWDRYVLHAVPDGKGDIRTDFPVIADVIDTPDLARFSAYGIEACYQFHGYTLADVAQVDLTGGITGQAMSYTSQQFGSWSIVYWILPVKVRTGTFYERTVLYVQNVGQGVMVAPTKHEKITNIAGSLDRSNPVDARAIRNRDFLVQFAKELIVSQAMHSKSYTGSVALGAGPGGTST